jgi:hypothetical protein
MAQEPISIFARLADPAGVARRLRELLPTVEIAGPDDAWSNAVLGYSLGGERRTLTLTHNPEYYAEPNWSRQMQGMSGYFSRFPETDRKAIVLNLPTTFRFSLGTIFEPDFDPSGDPRLDALFAVAELLDGVLFTPSSLRDAQGRILFGAGGEEEEDPSAVWPKVVHEVNMTQPLGAAMHEASRPRTADEPDDKAAEAPSPERVACRALALAAVSARAVLEQDAAEDWARESYQEILDWVRDVGFGDELEPDEWTVVQRPLGKLAPQVQIDSTWCIEGLVVLAWALGRFDLPPHDELVDVNGVWHSLGLNDVAAGRAVLDRPQLRSRDEIRTLRNRLFAVHWRLRNYGLRPEVTDFAEFARTCWFGPLDISGLPLVRGDLALNGRRIDQSPPDALAKASSAAQERHRAVIWLWEGPERYSEVAAHT